MEIFDPKRKPTKVEVGVKAITVTAVTTAATGRPEVGIGMGIGSVVASYLTPPIARGISRLKTRNQG